MKLAHIITLLFIISALLGLMIRFYIPDTKITSLNADGSFVISESKIVHKTFSKNIVLDIMDIICTKSFKADNKEKSEKDLIKTLRNVSKTAGAKPSEIRTIAAKLNKVKTMIQSNSDIRNNEELKKLSPKEDKSIFVPFIYNITKDKAYDSESKESDDIIFSELNGEPCSGCDDLD